MLESEDFYDKSRVISRSMEASQFALPVLPRILNHKTSSHTHKPEHRPQFRQLGHLALPQSKHAASHIKHIFHTIVTMLHPSILSEHDSYSRSTKAVRCYAL